MAGMNSVPAQRLRFRRLHRVRRTARFARIYREGSRARGSMVTVAVLPNGGEHTRLGLSVGKRCWKSAVRRNRVRRVFREAFRLSLPQLPPSIDVVVIASVPALRPTLDEARRELLRLVPKALRRYHEKTGDAGGREGS